MWSRSLAAAAAEIQCAALGPSFIIAVLAVGRQAANWQPSISGGGGGASGVARAGT